MLDAKVTELINTQINKEFYSAYLYLDFANFYKSKGLDGFYNWYMVQTQEERDHAMLFLKYLQNNNAEVTLEAVDKPHMTLEKLIDPLKAGLCWPDQYPAPDFQEPPVQREAALSRTAPWRPPV